MFKDFTVIVDEMLLYVERNGLIAVLAVCLICIAAIGYLTARGIRKTAEISTPVTGDAQSVPSDEEYNKSNKGGF